MGNFNKKPETMPEERVRLGDALAALGRKIELTSEDFATFEKVRDKAPAEPTKSVACCSELRHATSS